MQLPLDVHVLPSYTEVSLCVCSNFCSELPLFLDGSLLSKQCVLLVEFRFLLDADLIPPDCMISTLTGEHMQETIPPCPSISRRMAT